MGDRQPTDDNPNDLSRFERADRIQRRISFIAHAILALVLAYFVCALKADYDESMAVIEACKHNQTWKCMREAREAHRQDHR